MIAAASPAVAGWCGKLPSLGDFASRRLAPGFLRAWDEWLQEVLPASRAGLGEAWLDSYLTMPIWRFVLLPGLLGSGGWAGVLMPSVDRVGRQFPLTVAVALPSLSAAAHAIFDGAEWFAEMEAAALGALDVTRGPEDLDGALAACPFNWLAAPEDDGSEGALHRLPTLAAFMPLARAQALGAWSRQGGWRALWWTQGRVDGDPLVLTSAGLPTAEEFARLLGARPPAQGTRITSRP